MARLAAASTVIVPVVHSTRRGANSDLAAALAMAVGYARRDVDGEMYRDLIEGAMGEHPVAFLAGVGIARSLFPDIPMPTYSAHDLHVGDVLTLVRLALQRRGHLVPVFAVNLGRIDPARLDRGTCAITLREWSQRRGAHRTLVGEYWDPGAPAGQETLTPDDASLAAAFQECAVVGTLPPARL